jgi:hypothetical protein
MHARLSHEKAEGDTFDGKIMHACLSHEKAERLKTRPQ